MESSVQNSKLVDHLFRNQAGKMIAALTRVFGIHNLQLAEDVVQEAFLKATQSWTYHQIPDNPSAWLMQVAKNRAVDILRRNQQARQYSKEISYKLQHEAENIIEQLFHDSEISDSQLRLIFACCHPQLKPEEQIAFTLKTVSGFGTKEIARAFLTNEEAIQKRIYRAKQHIKENDIQLEIPVGKDLVKRLETVHAVMYLLFNEGYNSSKSDELIRHDLCSEAIRLCKLLSEHKAGKDPATYALLSLMCFHAARFESRMDENNAIVLLAEQDRSLWDTELIRMGNYYLNLSSAGNTVTIYHVESAIAATHCNAITFIETDWNLILKLYELLMQMKPSPLIELNRCVVLAELGAVDQAVDRILSISNIEKLLKTEYLYNAVLGDLYLRMNKTEEGTDLLLQAYALTSSKAEKELITKKIQKANLSRS
jgi:RNA polymerase sigma factor (sigma-70 family)